MSDTSEESLIN